MSPLSRSGQSKNTASPPFSATKITSLHWALVSLHPADLLLLQHRPQQFAAAGCALEERIGSVWFCGCHRPLWMTCPVPGTCRCQQFAYALFQAGSLAATRRTRFRRQQPGRSAELCIDGVISSAWWTRSLPAAWCAQWHGCDRDWPSVSILSMQACGRAT